MEMIAAAMQACHRRCRLVSGAGDERALPAVALRYLRVNGEKHGPGGK
jgi:hypothetical protein